MHAGREDQPGFEPKDAPAALPVGAMVAAWSEQRWQRLSVTEGSKEVPRLMTNCLGTGLSLTGNLGGTLWQFQLVTKKNRCDLIPGAPGLVNQGEAGSLAVWN